MYGGCGGEGGQEEAWCSGSGRLTVGIIGSSIKMFNPPKKRYMFIIL